VCTISPNPRQYWSFSDSAGLYCRIKAEQFYPKR
jgi:hypothetical protein